MNGFEDILDKALTELKNGTPKDVIFSTWPQHKQQLEQFLNIAEALSGLPKNTVPAPVMQRKYLHMPIKSQAWFAWVHVSRFVSVSMGALLLIAGFATTAYGVAQSLPGQVLFPLRKTAEQIQLHFASNDIEKANIQLKITQERLADAQEVFSSSNPSSAQQVAALNELTSQTDTALQTVKSAAGNDQNKSPLVASLQNLSNQQQALLKKIDSTNNGSASATGTSPQAVALNQFKLMAATTNEQTALISLNPNSNVAVNTVLLTYMDQNIVVASNTTFSISSDTKILDADQKTLLYGNLKVGQVVTIIGIKLPISGQLVAKEILVAAVKGVSTGTTGTSTTTPIITATSTATSTKVLLPGATLPTSTSTDIPLPPPSQAVGTFIPEDPSPQFKP